MEQDTLTQQQKIAQSNAANVSVPDFLLKTFQMLEDTKHSSYISWSKDGSMLIIKKPLAFADEILPIFFKHNNLSSFIRQLNNYSFRKMKSKEYEYCFYHEMFKRGRRDLLKFIKRKKVTRPKSHKHTAKHSTKKSSPQTSHAEAAEKLPVKKIHTEDNSSIAVFQENQIQHLRQANQQLQDELTNAQTQSRSLRFAITALADYYGSENIQTIIKMGNVEKDPSPQNVIANLQTLNGNQILEQSPNNQKNGLFSGDQLMSQTQPQSFSDYVLDPFSSFAKPEKAFQFGSALTEGVETADNLSLSPRITDEQIINYPNILDQPIGSINTKQEPDFFREDSANSNYPFSKLNYTF